MTLAANDFAEEEQERRNMFWAAVVIELFVIVDRELKTGSSQDEALASAFEDLFHRIDFENMDVVASHTANHKVDLNDLKYTFIAIAFGNFLHQHGVSINEVPVEQ